MDDYYVTVSDRVSFSKTVSESDVYLFAGITEDLSPNHLNKAYMEKSSFRKLMAHGVLRGLAVESQTSNALSQRITSRERVD